MSYTDKLLNKIAVSMEVIIENQAIMLKQMNMLYETLQSFQQVPESVRNEEETGVSALV